MSHTTDTSTRKIENLYAFLDDYKNEELKEKVLDLYEKSIRKEMVIGFAGHFSAGKSTLINALLDKDILPSSPIPTSANIVQLKSGAPYTIAHFQDGGVVQYDAEIDLDTIQELCKDGEKITGLEISQHHDDLPPRVSIVDTPGVDSTNDADRLITESSLHLMDYMYYVMDYNHVQSEVNLMFLSEMQRRKTSFSVVINQVDKHMDRELSFETYQETVNSAFAKWGIEPENIYYTSMRNFSLSFNDFQKLRGDFRGLFQPSEKQLEDGADYKVRSIAEEAVHHFSDDMEEKLTPLREEKEKWDGIIEDSPFHIKDLESHQLVQGHAESDFQERIRTFISNAYLMPSSLREYAESYLESVQPNFKVGLLFSQKKTEEERRLREKEFYDRLMDSVEKNLYWPMRERMVQLMDHYSVNDRQLVEHVQNEPFHYPKERLASLVEKGASVTGAYVLRYTDEVAKDIQKEARSFVQDWKQMFLQAISENRQLMIDQHKEVFEAVEQVDHLENKMEELNLQIKEFQSELNQRLQKPNSNEETLRMKKASEERTASIVYRDADNLPKKKEMTDEDSEEKEEVLPKKERSSIEQGLERADAALTSISSMKGTKRLYHQLKNKRDRLEDRHYTVALFGAFSAGKSSFANALLGDLVLPVSPNPTTATINKISPSNDKKPNRSIDAYVKTENEMLEDLNPVVEDLGYEALHLDDVYKFVVNMEREQWEPLDQKKHSFLQAFIDGYPMMKSNLGKRLDVAWSDFSSYVSLEEKSCFIESMELFYDCPWTEAGVTLVDTPGADSVNARHTNVSFEYIKDSDAVLFVTYYNHPFSHADQTFLKQLGRVKDSFSLDKMFFLINAADLASTEEERIYVEQYVRGQLNEFQIRSPKIFSVSSLHALEEKTEDVDKGSGIQAFEKSFRAFLEEDLAQMMIHAIDEDISGIRQVLEDFIATSRLSEKERQKEIEMVEQEKQNITAILAKDFDIGMIDVVHNKVIKQIHFVQERMMLNFNDLFKRHYNPATIQRDGDLKESLKTAQNQLLDELSFEMLQEVKAVCVRIEHFIEQLMVQTKERMERDLHTVRPSIQLSQMELGNSPMPQLVGRVEMEEKEKALLRKMFRNPKAFFEKNEKEDMKQTMAHKVDENLKIELQSLAEVIQVHYKEVWNSQYVECKDVWKEDVYDLYNQLHSHLEKPEGTEELESILKKLPQV